MKGYSFGYIWNRLLKKIRGKAVLGSNIPATSKVESGSQAINSSFGKYSFCGYDCKILNCQIGSFTSIADKVVIGGTRHPYEWVSTSPVFYKGHDSVKQKFSNFTREDDPLTTIGSDVWIGEGAYIKAGITIGHGAVIGMGSIVTKDVLPYTIVVGVPAEMVKKRFENDVCEQLLMSEWWNLSDEKLVDLGQFIQDPQVFLSKITSSGLV